MGKTKRQSWLSKTKIKNGQECSLRLYYDLNGEKSVSFDDSLNGSNTLGVCRYGGDMIVPEIRINRQFWKVASMISREQLMFHEMGHCVLGRPHNASEYLGYYPLSIMNPYFFGDNLYTVNYNSYVNELFLNKTPSVIYASGVSQFPAGAYASTALTSYASTQKVQEYSVSVESSEKTLTDEDYKNIENFGCGDEE
jgi:hypothetical protein